MIGRQGSTSLAGCGCQKERIRFQQDEPAATLERGKLGVNAAFRVPILRYER